MRSYKKLVKLTLISVLSLYLVACGSGGKTAVSSVSEEVAETEQPISEIEVPEPVEIVEENLQVLFSEDIVEDIRQSTPTDINLPLGLQATFDIEYLGAFRVVSDGESTSDYAIGTLGFNPENNSIFMAGHSHNNAVAEFEIPSELSFEEQVTRIPEAAVLQQYEQVLNKKEIGNTNDKITGLLYYNHNLLVSSEIWYDGAGSNADNLQVFSNAHDISSSAFKGMLQVEGKAKAAGYMFKVPAELTEKIGSEYLIGWATNYGIVSRYSQGPSLYRFEPEQAIESVLSVDPAIDTEALMVFPFSAERQLVEGSDLYTLDISPIWGPITNAKYGFIIPGTTYFLAVGRHSGLHSGIGYKITQDNGNVCGGPCAYEIDDIYNYFWVFDVNDMLEADDPWSVQPISYGKWSHPYDDSGSHDVIGGAFDDQNSILYLTLSEAGQTGLYDRAPLIISYAIKAKQ